MALVQIVKTSSSGGGGGSANLGYFPAPTNGTVTNTSGTSAVIPLADSTNAGLFSPSEKTKLAGIQAGAEVNVNADWSALVGTDAYILNKPDLSIYVPYTGATTDVDLGTHNLTADHISLNVNPSGAGYVVGTTQWNDTKGVSETKLKGGNVSLKNGIDLVAYVRNNSGSNLLAANYQVVKVTTGIGQSLTVNLAKANNDANSVDTLGVVIENINNNQDGFILTVGEILNINTSGSLQSPPETWADGDPIYLSTTTFGALTKVKPDSTQGHIVVIGYVIYAHPTQGKLYVKVQNGWELDELHNVFIDPLTLANKNVLAYNSTSQLWENETVQDVITLVTTPTSGDATLIGNTLTIPNYGGTPTPVVSGNAVFNFNNFI